MGPALATRPQAGGTVSFQDWKPPCKVVLSQIVAGAQAMPSNTTPPPAAPLVSAAQAWGSGRRQPVCPRGDSGWRAAPGMAGGVPAEGQVHQKPESFGAPFARFGAPLRLLLPSCPPGYARALASTQSVLSLERGAKPVTSFVKNLSALSDWYSVYTSAIAFTVSAPQGEGGTFRQPSRQPASTVPEVSLRTHAP